jgi:hypothetical protein
MDKTMKKNTILSSILSLLLLILFTACQTSFIDEALPEFKGMVTDAYTNQPIAQARITLGNDQATTDIQGSYTIAEWQSQDTLEISAPGYEPVHMVLEENPHLVDVIKNVVPLTTMLRPNILSGIVVDRSTGEPIHGAIVNAQYQPTEMANTSETQAMPSATQTISTTTNANGTYMLADLPTTFRLNVSSNDYKPYSVDIHNTTNHSVELQPDIIRGHITNYLSGKPVPDAIVTVGSNTTMTDQEGAYFVRGIPNDATTMTINAEGYMTVTETLPSATVLNIVLHPTQITARLRDTSSGKPIAFATIIATPSLTDTAVAMERIDNAPDGQFTLEQLPEQGYIQILAPGYRKAVLEIKPGSFPSDILLEPFYVKSLYIKSSTAAFMPDVLDEFFAEIDRTELNALVIDLKSDNIADLGLIYYQSNVPIIKKLGTSADLFDIRAILAEARKRSIYTIARIHVFSHDNVLAETKPEWAAHDKRGCVPNENRHCNGDIFYADWDVAWLDTWNRNLWDYNIQLGVEAAQLGFDEIQFDYIRFASDAKNIEDMKLSRPTDPEKHAQAMYENIATFMQQAHEAMNAVGAFFSVDVFGYAAWQPQATIGQNLSLMAPHADYICPMVYPSHFLVNELGFDNAAAHPYEIVLESLQRGEKMIEGRRAKLRPWLQDFTLLWMPDELIVEYGPKEVRAQIDATEVFTGSTGWALWNSDNEYTFDALYESK